MTEKTSGGVSREVKEGHVKRSGNILELAFLRSRCAFGILHHFRSFTWVGGLVMTFGLKYSKLLSNYCHFIGEFAINNTF